MRNINHERIKAQLELTGDIMRSNAEAKLYDVVRNVQELATLAKSLHRRYEAACSYKWANTDKYRKCTENMENNAVKLASDIGLTLGLQTDPRGWPFILRVGMIEHRLG